MTRFTMLIKLEKLMGTIPGRWLQRGGGAGRQLHDTGIDSQCPGRDQNSGGGTWPSDL